MISASWSATSSEVPFGDAVHQAEFQCAFGVDRFTGQRDLGRDLERHLPLQTDHTARGRQQSAPDLQQSEGGGLVDDGEVACQHDFGTATEREPVDHRDVFLRPESRLGSAFHAACAQRFAVTVEVQSGAEGSTVTGQHDRSYASVVTHFGECVPEPLDQLRVHRVQPARTGGSDQEDARADFLGEHRVLLWGSCRCR